MLDKLTDHLSIWEISHRWHGYDPNNHDENNIPLQVQDTIRLITKAAFQHVMGITVRGADLKWEKHVPSYADFLENQDDYMYRIERQFSARLGHVIIPSELRKSELHDCWGELRELIIGDHEREVDSFPDIYLNRKYDKAVLEHVHLSKDNVLRFCHKHDLEPPGFMFPEGKFKTEPDEFNQPLKVDQSQSSAGNTSNFVDGFPTDTWTFYTDIANRAYREWWSTYDPEDRNTAPNREEIIKWLVETFSISKEAASTIQIAIRAPETSKGGTKNR